MIVRSDGVPLRLQRAGMCGSDLGERGGRVGALSARVTVKCTFVQIAMLAPMLLCE